jgi:hypothetical protein
MKRGDNCEPFVGRAMGFRARVERLGAFGVTSVSLIVAKRGGQTKCSETAGSKVSTAEFQGRVRHSSSAQKGQCSVE